MSNSFASSSENQSPKPQRGWFLFGWRASLKAKLPLAFILLSGTSLIVSAFLGIQIFRNSLISAVQDRLEKESALHAEATRDYLIWTQSMAIDLAASMESASYSQEALLNIIENTLTRNTQIFGSAIAFEPFQFDADQFYWAPYYSRGQFGRIVFTQLGNPTYNYFEADWYTLPKTLNSPVLSPPYFDDGGGNIWMVTWSVPFYANDGTFRGVATADIAFSDTQTVVSEIQVGERGYAFLIDQKGTVLGIGENGGAYKPMEESILLAPESENAAEWNGVIQRMIAGDSNFQEIIDPQGREQFIFFEPIGLGTGWSIALVYPKDEVLLPVTQLSATLFFTVALILVVFSVLLYLFSQTITRPVELLAAHARELTQAKTPLAIRENMERVQIRTGDELEELGDAFNQMTNDLVASLETLGDRVEERTAELTIANRLNQRRARQFEAIAQISRVINQTQGLQDLLPQITQLISQYFGFYHVGIFLLDTRKEFANLVASNSEGGQRMLAREHRLRVGQVGIVGTVAGTSKPRIALDTGADAIYFNNPDLPETRSEMALPLFSAGSQILGVLDVQSTEPNAFNQEDIEILSTLTDQVSLAITNASLYEQTQKALVESEMVYRRELRSGWRKFNRAKGIFGIRRRGANADLLTEPIEIQQTELDSNETGARYSQIAIPMKLRGETVGVLNIKSDKNRVWTADEMDIVSAIAERAALSIENARLIAESRKIAEKERLIGEISTRVSSFTNRENILQTAVTEIGRAIPGAEISIQIQRKGDEGAS